MDDIIGDDGKVINVAEIFEKQPKKSAIPYMATPEDRDLVLSMAIAGIPQAAMAKVIGCREPVLREQFRAELDEGMAKCDAKVVQTLFDVATKDRNVSALIFWAKVRLGWRDVNRMEVEVSGKNFVDAPRRMTKEEWIEARRVKEIDYKDEEEEKVG